MLPYIIVFIILLIGLALFNGRPYSLLSDSWLYIEWISFVLLAGLRYRVGGDTLAYYDMYQNWPSLSGLFNDVNTENYGILWRLLLSLCKSITNDFVLFQLIHAVFVNASFFIFFRRYSRRVFFITTLFFLLFFFKYNTEILRASFAVSFFLWSYKYLINQRWLPYLILTAIAIGFHSEAMIMLLFPFIMPLKKLKIDFKALLLLFGISIALLLPNLLPFFDRLFTFSSSVSERLAYYSDNSLYGVGISFWGYLKTFVWSSIWLFVLYVLKCESSCNLNPFIILHFILCIISIKYSNVFYRMMDFTFPIMLVSIGKCIDILNTHHIYLFLLYACIALLLYDQILYFTNTFVLFYPYSSVFNPIDYSFREIYFYELFH